MQLLLKTYPSKKISSLFGIILAYFRFSFWGQYTKLILPPERKPKIGSKEPKNRQKLFTWIGSNTVRTACLLVLALLCGCSQYTPPQDTLVAIHIQDRNGITETVSIPERLCNYEQMDFLDTQPYKKVLRVFKKEGKNHSIITAYHPNGTIAEYLEAEDMRARGSFREWFSNGQLKVEATVIGGTADITPAAKRDWLFEGTCQVWDEQGHLVAAIPYDKGLLQGTSISYFPSGTVYKQTTYVRNMEQGEAIEFYPSGMLRVCQQYNKGQKSGTTRGFFETGQTAYIEEYVDSLLLQGAYHNMQGDRLAVVEDGRGVQAIYCGNYVALLVETHQGVPEGAIRKFNSNGTLIATYSFKNGRKHGEEIEYYLPSDTDGKELKPKLSVQWDQDRVHGIVKTWYPTGQLQSQREYCRNEKLGPSCAWYTNGSLMFIEEYEGKKLLKGAYYKKGQNEPVSTIINGNGLASLYDENGAFMKKAIYLNGKPVLPEDD